MNTWSRIELKGNARQVLSRTYGKMLIISLLLTALQMLPSQFTVQFKFPYQYLSLSEINYNLRALFLHREVDWDFRRLMAGILLFIFMMSLIGALFQSIIRIFLTAPLEVSIKRFLLFNRCSDQADLKELSYAFRYSYLNIVKVLFFQFLYIFLWGLLFWVPGIIKSYEYRMIPYLLAENPNLSKDEAFAISKRMMDGEKWEAFVLDWSFIGFYILSIFTFGLLSIFYVTPYKVLTDTELYAALKGKEMEQGINQGMNQV